MLEVRLPLRRKIKLNKQYNTNFLLTKYFVCLTKTYDGILKTKKNDICISILLQCLTIFPSRTIFYRYRCYFTTGIIVRSNIFHTQFFFKKKFEIRFEMIFLIFSKKKNAFENSQIKLLNKTNGSSIICIYI